jgi:hypothetical protein
MHRSCRSTLAPRTGLALGVLGLLLLLGSGAGAKPLYHRASRVTSPAKEYRRAQKRWTTSLNKLGGDAGLKRMLERVAQGKKLETKDIIRLADQRRLGKQLRSASAMYGVSGDLAQVQRFDKFLKSFGHLKDSLRVDAKGSGKAGKKGSGKQIKPTKRSMAKAKKTLKRYKAGKIARELEGLKVATPKQVTHATQARLARIKRAMSTKGQVFDAESFHDLRKDLFDLRVSLARAQRRKPNDRRLANAHDQVKQLTSVMGQMNDALEQQVQKTSASKRSVQFSLTPLLTDPIKAAVRALEAK